MASHAVRLNGKLNSQRTRRFEWFEDGISAPLAQIHNDSCGCQWTIVRVGISMQSLWKVGDWSDLREETLGGQTIINRNSLLDSLVSRLWSNSKSLYDLTIAQSGLWACAFYFHVT